MPYGKKSKLTKKVTGKKKPAKTNPGKKKVVKKTTVVKPSTKKKVTVGLDRFANYRNIPGAKPIRFAANGGGVTMMDKNGHTFTVGPRKSRSKKK